MRYCFARYGADQLGRAYQIYMADALRVATENTSRYVGGNYVKIRFADLIAPRKAETRTADEIKEHMKGVLGRLAVNE